MRKAVFAGTFDPITKGHEKVIEKASELFDEVIVAICVNPEKTTLFPKEVRFEMLKYAVKKYPNVKAVTHDGLVVDLMRSVGAKYYVRGVRNNTDYAYENDTWFINKGLYPEMVTIYFPCEKELLDISYRDNYGKKQMLSVVDIASFLSVTNFAKVTEINGVLNLIKAEINTGLINDSESLDDNVFLPIENHPEMLTQIGKLENGYKHLSPMRRGEIISTYRDVVEASDYKLITLSKEIAEATLKDTRQSMARLLFEGAESLSRKKFKALLKSLTPEQYSKLYEEYANCNDATSEQEFFDSYIDKFAK